VIGGANDLSMKLALDGWWRRGTGHLSRSDKLKETNGVVEVLLLLQFQVQRRRPAANTLLARVMCVSMSMCSGENRERDVYLCVVNRQLRAGKRK
jgi:hypothetical protein